MEPWNWGAVLYGLAFHLSLHIPTIPFSEIHDSWFSYLNLLWICDDFVIIRFRLARWVLFPSFEILAAICWLSIGSRVVRQIKWESLWRSSTLGVNGAAGLELKLLKGLSEQYNCWNIVSYSQLCYDYLCFCHRKLRPRINFICNFGSYRD